MDVQESYYACKRVKCHVIVVGYECPTSPLYSRFAVTSALSVPATMTSVRDLLECLSLFPEGRGMLYDLLPEVQECKRLLRDEPRKVPLNLKSI